MCNVRRNARATQRATQRHTNVQRKVQPEPEKELKMPAFDQDSHFARDLAKLRERRRRTVAEKPPGAPKLHIRMPKRRKGKCHPVSVWAEAARRIKRRYVQGRRTKKELSRVPLPRVH